jgi:hypothetical protein
MMPLSAQLLAIYNRQTSDEQESKTTKYSNNIGFSASDAPLGSYCAKWILKGNHLSGKYLDLARNMAIKYRVQLLKIARNKYSHPE